MREVKLYNILELSHMYSVRMRNGEIFSRLVFQGYLPIANELEFLDINMVPACKIRINKDNIGTTTDMEYGNEFYVANEFVQRFEIGDFCCVHLCSGKILRKMLIVGENRDSLVFINAMSLCEHSKNNAHEECSVRVDKSEILKLYIYE